MTEKTSAVLMMECVVCVCFIFLCVSAMPSPVRQLPPSEDEEDSESDGGLYGMGLYQGDIFRRQRRAMESSTEAHPWPNGLIIYKVDDKIGCPESTQCQLLMRAINHYHKHTCVRFQEWTGEESYVSIFYSASSSACWSAVGHIRGEQPLSLGRRCWYQGIVIHELGHSVGLWHEMNRPDRDHYITINWRNILSGFAPAFDKQKVEEYKHLDDDFDFESIMMYDEYAFAKDKESPTIETKDRSIIGPIWRKPGLSRIDMRRIRDMYECPEDGTPLTASFPYDILCTFDSHTCGFKSAGSHSWRWHQINATEGYVYNTKEIPVQEDSGARNSSGDNTAFFVSVNFLGATANQADSDSSMGCVRFWYLVRGGEDAYLKLRQSYLSQPTQLQVLPEDTFDVWESSAPSESWSFVQMPLYVNAPFKVIFESSPGEAANGLVGIDQVEIQFSGACSSHTRTLEPSLTF